MTADASGPELDIVGAKLSPSGRTLEFDARGMTLAVGEVVVVEDARGVEVATVCVRSARRRPRGPLGRVLRRADERDLARREANLRRAHEALGFAREQARARNLPIKVFRAELPYAGGRASFYFSSETRIDFRDLVRDLAARLHLFIEMRQVGVRDEAKMVGGIGSCGQELCCTTFLPSFTPVSIKMAKNQNLVLNPARVTGQCGRLKCCLVYEEAAYVEAGKGLPRPGKRVETPQGPGRVSDVDILGGKVRVTFEEGPPAVYTAQELVESRKPRV